MSLAQVIGPCASTRKHRTVFVCRTGPIRPLHASRLHIIDRALYNTTLRFDQISTRGINEEGREGGEWGTYQHLPVDLELKEGLVHLLVDVVKEAAALRLHEDVEDLGLM